MTKSQRYISDELSHFVGKGKLESEQYDILVNKILKTGWLTYPPHDITRPRGLSLDFSSPISEDKALKYEVVCFCDIPDSDLAIHVSKYSKFGLAFNKDFLIAKGACPVFYVANESRVSAQSHFSPREFALELVEAAKNRGFMDRALYFSTSVRALLDIFAALDALCNDEDRRFFKGGVLTVAECKTRFGRLLGLTDAQILAVQDALKGNEQAKRSLAIFQDFLIAEVFSFIKCFDAKCTFDDPKNYYMEREWRIGNHVNFCLSDVSRVFFPSQYAAAFRKDVPNYLGQISFIE